MFTCDLCDRGFVTGGGIANHLEALHPQDTSALYRCKKCGKEFTSLKAMTEHYRNKHGATQNPAKPAMKTKVSKSSLDAAKDYPAAERREMEKQGKAMKGQKFPIKDCGDVKDAVHRLGNQKGVSDAAVKRHIIKRAKALGCSNLPEGWG